MERKEIIDAYCQQMIQFFKKGQGNIFDWLVSLDKETLEDLQHDENSDVVGAFGVLAYSYANADETGKCTLDENLAIEIINSMDGMVSLAYLKKLNAISIDYDCEIFDLDCLIEWKKGEGFEKACEELGVNS